MNGWFGDFFRTAWALWYWNTRKTFFAIRGRRGHCPCHNPSDSGQPLATGCEAITLWHRPERFQKRVCPLLAKNARGQWVCSVAPAEVKPFWVRTFRFYGGGLALAVVIAGLAAWGGMRYVGYRVTLAQIFWPPKWSELRATRVELFLEQAKGHFQAGRVREAIAALRTAHEMRPDDYDIAMMLAQFYQASGPEGADRIYGYLLMRHRDRGAEIARIWFSSLLARGLWPQAADLARERMLAEPAQTVPWARALIFSATRLGKPELLDQAAGRLALSEEVRAVLQLNAAVLRAQPGTAAKIVKDARFPAKWAYARVRQIELLIEHRETAEALRLLGAGKNELSGRDVVRLAFAAYAVEGEHQRLRDDVARVLAPEKKLEGPEVTLVAQHLIRYPDREILPLLVSALNRVEHLPPDKRLELAMNVLCAAGSCEELAVLSELGKQLRDADLISYAAVQRLGIFFAEHPNAQTLQSVLPTLQPFGLELSYALRDRYAN